MSGSVRHATGVTLIESLLALLISALLMTVLLTLCLAAARTHRTVLAYQALQDNAVFALRALTTAVQQAGRVGCARLTATLPLQGDLSLQNRLTGTVDRLVVRGGGVETGYLVQPMPTSQVLYISGDLPVLRGDRLLVSDCRTVDILQVRTVEKIPPDMQKIIALQPLSTRYPAMAEVRHYEESAYFVAPTGRRDATGQGISALYRMRSQDYRSELVAGVDALQLRYTLSQDQPHRTVSASVVTDGSQVIGVHFTLQLSTPAPAALKKTRYGYAVLRE